MNYLHDDGSLVLAEWGRQIRPFRHVDGEMQPGEAVHVHGEPRSKPMYGTTATGEDLVSNGQLGVDLVRVPAGGGFAPHTHPGDHLLIVVAGEGTITYQGQIYPTRAGQVYMVEGSVPHAVGAITDHCILAVGSPHRRLDSADRMTLTEYAAVAAEFGELTCLACPVAHTGTPDELAAAGCTHVPTRPPAGRLLFVGIAPAGPEYVTQPAFHETRSGKRLASLLGYADTKQMLEQVDTANLIPEYVDDWQSIPVARWREAASRLASHLVGRVVVACGPQVATHLGGLRQIGAVALVHPAPSNPALVLTIPHPSGLSRTWNAPEVVEQVRTALATARTLAAVGPPTGSWTERDAVELEKVTLGVIPD